ncbi:MAG TPA: VacJ family lipoprotein [Steroidobacteraceae bacterium]|nr:VacJ family lipoprotein [Steroidobacteraceae bacterium]
MPGSSARSLVAASSALVLFIRKFAFIGCALALVGCATTPGRTVNDDRFEGFNRGVYKFNDTIDRAALKPVAKGYEKVTPHWMRIGVSNFFSNLEYPAVVINQFLQGKGKLGLRDTGRFLINTTLGLGGILDVATHMGLDKNDEDFGQTLAKWGVSSGPYLTLPLFGPSSLRDAPSRVVDYFFHPSSYWDIPWEAQWGQRTLDVVQMRAGLLPLDPTLQRAYDPYAFIRDAWVQQREFAIFDGNPPPETLEEELPMDEDVTPEGDTQAEPVTPTPSPPER